MSRGKVRYQAGAEEVEMVSLFMLSPCSLVHVLFKGTIPRDYRCIVMDTLVQLMVVCWYCIVTGEDLKGTVSRENKFFRMRVVDYFSSKMGKPDAAGADCLGCGGRVELWLQGVRFEYLNPNNAVAVVEGMVSMEKWVMFMGERKLRGVGNNLPPIGIGLNTYTRGPKF